MGLVGSQVGCLPGRSIIPGGIPGGIPPISGGIPPGINLGSQVGLAGSRLTFLPGMSLGVKSHSLADSQLGCCSSSSSLMHVTSASSTVQRDGTTSSSMSMISNSSLSSDVGYKLEVVD